MKIICKKHNSRGRGYEGESYRELFSYVYRYMHWTEA